MVADQIRPVSKRLRYEILRRDNHTCRYCGQAAPDVKLQVDHVLPVALGGTNVAENLVAACADCNIGKASSTVSESLVGQVSADARRWSLAVKASSQILAADYAARSEYLSVFQDEWMSRGYGFKDKPAPLEQNWEFSIGLFFDRQFPIEALIDSIRVAANAGHVEVANKWRYFMGICWKRLTEIEDLAKRVFDQMDTSEESERG